MGYALWMRRALVGPRAAYRLAPLAARPGSPAWPSLPWLQGPGALSHRTTSRIGTDACAGDPSALDSTAGLAGQAGLPALPASTVYIPSSRPSDVPDDSDDGADVRDVHVPHIHGAGRPALRTAHPGTLRHPDPRRAGTASIPWGSGPARVRARHAIGCA